MTELMARPVTRIWLALMVITGITTWGLTERHVPVVLGTIGILVLAAVKIALVMGWFMEVRHAPLPWQAYFAGWIVATTGLVVGFYLLG